MTSTHCNHHHHHHPVSYHYRTRATLKRFHQLFSQASESPVSILTLHVATFPSRLPETSRLLRLFVSIISPSDFYFFSSVVLFQQMAPDLCPFLTFTASLRRLLSSVLSVQHFLAFYYSSCPPEALYISYILLSLSLSRCCALSYAWLRTCAFLLLQLPLLCHPLLFILCFTPWIVLYHLFSSVSPYRPPIVHSSTCPDHCNLVNFSCFY